MICPNCDRELDPDKPTAARHPDYVHSNPNLGHNDGCMLRALLIVIEDREDNDLTGIRLEAINIDFLWDRINPIADATERELGITTPPEHVTIKRVARAECDDCEKVWLVDDLDEPENLSQRLDVGGTVPAGQCPDCGALAYSKKEN